MTRAGAVPARAECGYHRRHESGGCGSLDIAGDVCGAGRGECAVACPGSGVDGPGSGVDGAAEPDLGELVAPAIERPTGEATAVAAERAAAGWPARPSGSLPG